MTSVFITIYRTVHLGQRDRNLALQPPVGAGMHTANQHPVPLLPIRPIRRHPAEDELPAPFATGTTIEDTPCSDSPCAP